MSKTNEALYQIFSEMASALELLGANPFRSVSNNRVAREIRDLTDDIAEVAGADLSTAVGRLSALSGIGKGSAKRIVEFLETGEVAEHQALMAKVPEGLFAVLAVPGIGPKAARLMWQDLEIASIADLKAQIDTPAFAALPRMGAKKIENIRQAIQFSEQAGERIPIGKALPIAEALLDALAALPGVDKADYCGSLRRGRETIGDIDFLVTCTDPDVVRTFFTEGPSVTQVLANGETKCSVRLETDGVAVQADLRLVPAEVYGAALMYFTGSKDHNVRLRERSIKRGMRLNEYGLFEGNEERPQDRGQAPVAAATEEAIYAALELPFIAPELREDRGELDRAPVRLIEVSDIGAELHSHTTASDGRLSIEALALAARARGLHTIAITDHSVSQVIANGLTPERLVEHMAAIRAVDARLDDIAVLAGAEVDILADGRLDYEDSLLAQLDVVVASPHAALGQDSASATARLLAAIRHPLVHVIGHPTGRVINRRAGLDPDMTTLYRAAAEHGTALEINANPRRLDLRDNHVRGALAHGCVLAIDTDAHRQENFELLRYGVLTGRRGGLTPEVCINTWSHDDLTAWLKRKR